MAGKLVETWLAFLCCFCHRAGRNVSRILSVERGTHLLCGVELLLKFFVSTSSLLVDFSTVLESFGICFLHDNSDSQHQGDTRKACLLRFNVRVSLFLVAA
jgi:hypothetical protein